MTTRISLRFLSSFLRFLRSLRLDRWWLLGAAMLILPVFEARGSAIFTNVGSFNGANGQFPLGRLIRGSDSNVWGTCQSGGKNGNGVVFVVTQANTITNPFFESEYPLENVLAGLAQDNRGGFYGTAAGGGPGDAGQLFEFNFVLSNSWTWSYGASTGARTPSCDLLWDGNGHIFSTTAAGGAYGHGMVCVASTNFNALIVGLHAFTGGADGATPLAGLVLGAAGETYLYGTCSAGGSNALGTVFKLHPDGTLAAACSFTGGSDGGTPLAELTFGADSNFYGTTSLGGTCGNGTIFKTAGASNLTGLYSFTGGNDGANPHAPLIQATDGNFYGTTFDGGAHGYGTIFRMDTNWAVTTLHSFAGGNDGANPTGALMQYEGGLFYGTTSIGGPSSLGTVFKLLVSPYEVSPALPPAFLYFTSTDGALYMIWLTQRYSSYQLQYTTDLKSGLWTDIGGPVAATGATLTGTDSTSPDEQRFYRVMVVPESF